MGQASQRAARLKGLQLLCVGPSTLDTHGAAVVFVSKNLPDAKQRLLSAVKDVMTKHRALETLERLIRECQEDVGWIVVTYTPDGGVLYQQLVNSLEAIGHVLSLLGEGYAARKSRWTAMVFGTPSDLETVRSQAARFQADVELSLPAVAPVIAVLQGPDPKILLEIPRSDVDQMNLAPALLFFDTFTTSIEAVERMAGNVVVSFSGYDDDPRFLGEVPAVNAFLRQLVSFAPWTPLVLDTACFLLFVKALDSRVLIQNTGDQRILVESSPAVSKSILDGFTWTIAEFLASRLFVNEVPASLRGNILEWNAFLNSGPDVRPAPEWDL